MQTTDVAPTVAALPSVREASRLRDVLIHPLVLRIVSFAAVLGLWEYAGRIPLSAAFPTFLETLVGLRDIAADGSLGKAFLITLKPLLIGLSVSVVLGVGLGVLMGLHRPSEWLIAPIFIIAQAAPLAALIPVLTFAYGIGLTAKVLTVCIMAMPVIVLNTLGAVRNTPQSLLEMSRSFLASRGQSIRHVILPSASPMIFSGLRLGSAAAFIGVILAELLITPTGIGDIISYNQSIADYPKMYAAILSIIVFAVLFIELLERIEVSLFRPEKRP
ncbi:MAG: ABC transporter permease subunit [Burkholderiales bacterium]|nr:ABC transporter permease subunit [Burkholderiales bacterium]